MEKTKAQTKKTFEKAIAELEQIAESLENGNLGLDKSISEFEKGMKLAKFCREKLDEAERKINILQKDEHKNITKKKINIKKDTGEITDDEDIQGSLL
ncbi:MAG: exodeoxyribonuclease VII small subunit [Spirochaetota bacterium]|nr:exodeoxyribonuclease VII small subunit [Spirochaetota bacterium]